MLLAEAEKNGLPWVESFDTLSDMQGAHLERRVVEHDLDCSHWCQDARVFRRYLASIIDALPGTSRERLN